MRFSGVIVLALLAGAGAALAQQAPPLKGVTRIFVEPFHTTTGAEKLRDALIGQLKKLHSITLVADASIADAGEYCRGRSGSRGRWP